MERTPDTPHALIDTRDRLARYPLVLLWARVSQQLNLFSNPLWCQVLHVDRLLVTVEIVCGNDGVVVVLSVHLDLDLRVALREGAELVLEVGIHAA